MERFNVIIMTRRRGYSTNTFFTAVHKESRDPTENANQSVAARQDSDVLSKRWRHVRAADNGQLDNDVCMHMLYIETTRGT